MAASFRGLERWREDGRLTSVRSAQRVPPVSLKPVGVRACRALADGRLLSVNGLGVIEQFNYAWRDWQQPAGAAAAAAATAAAATGVTAAEAAAEEAEGLGEDGDEDEGDEGVGAGGGSVSDGDGDGGGGGDGEPGAEVKRCVCMPNPRVCWFGFVFLWFRFVLHVVLCVRITVSTGVSTFIGGFILSFFFFFCEARLYQHVLLRLSFGVLFR